MNRKRIVVAYCRVSTLEQKRRGYGIDIQIRDVTLFAERSGLFILRFYKDEAESGVEEDRTELQRLLKDCRAGRVAKVIVPSLDRLSRDVRLAENLFHEFDEAGVEVLIADMPAYNGRNRKDVLIRQIREAIAEDNRKDIIERLKKGGEERVRRGLPAGGNLGYCLAREGKKIVLVPEEIRIVRLIFAAANSGIRNIAVALNQRGFTRRNGKPWTARQVSAILARRPFYYDGMIRYGEASGQNRALAVLHEGAEDLRGDDPTHPGKGRA